MNITVEEAGRGRKGWGVSAGAAFACAALALTYYRWGGWRQHAPITSVLQKEGA